MTCSRSSKGAAQAQAQGREAFMINVNLANILLSATSWMESNRQSSSGISEL